MYGLNKKEKLKFILQKTEELNITAYEISKKTNLTEAGISRILNGTVKNPHENTLNTILEFLEQKVLGSNLDEDGNIVTREPETKYEPKSRSEILEEANKCLEESQKMMRHIMKLQNLLTKHNIPHDNYFEME